MSRIGRLNKILNSQTENLDYRYDVKAYKEYLKEWLKHKDEPEYLENGVLSFFEFSYCNYRRCKLIATLYRYTCCHRFHVLGWKSSLYGTSYTSLLSIPALYFSGTASKALTIASMRQDRLAISTALFPVESHTKPPPERTHLSSKFLSPTA